MSGGAPYLSLGVKIIVVFAVSLVYFEQSACIDVRHGRGRGREKDSVTNWNLANMRT